MSHLNIIFEWRKLEGEWNGKFRRVVTTEGLNVWDQWPIVSSICCSLLLLDHDLECDVDSCEVWDDDDDDDEDRVTRHVTIDKVIQWFKVTTINTTLLSSSSTFPRSHKPALTFKNVATVKMKPHHVKSIRDSNNLNWTTKCKFYQNSSWFSR